MAAQLTELSDDCLLALLNYITSPRFNVWCVRIKPTSIQIISRKPTQTRHSYFFKLTNNIVSVKIQKFDKTSSYHSVSEEQWEKIIENINHHEHTIVFDNIVNRDLETVVNPYYFSQFFFVIKTNIKKLQWKVLNIGDLKLYWHITDIQDSFKDSYSLCLCDHENKHYAFVSNTTQMYWASMGSGLLIKPDSKSQSPLIIKFEDLPAQFKRLKYNSFDNRIYEFNQIPVTDLREIIDLTYRSKLKWSCEIYNNYTLWSSQYAKEIKYTILSYEGYVFISIYSFKSSQNEIYHLKPGDFHVLLDFVARSKSTSFTVNESEYPLNKIELSQYARDYILYNAANHKWHVSVNTDEVHFICLEELDLLVFADSEVYPYGDLKIHYIYQANKAIITYSQGHYNRKYTTDLATADKTFIRNLTKNLYDGTDFKTLIRVHSNLPSSSNINADKSKYDFSDNQLTDLLKKYIFVNNTDAVKVVQYADILVKCNVFRCRIASHPIMNIITKVNVKDDSGTIKTVKIPAGYCKSCNTYFIHSDTFLRLKSMGRIMCRVIDQHNYEKWNEDSPFGNMQSNSILREYGYTVSKQSPLTTTERQAILSEMVDNRIITKYEIISYLNLFISLRSGDSSMDDAISCWKRDIEFISQYNTPSTPSVTAKSIYRK